MACPDYTWHYVENTRGGEKGQEHFVAANHISSKENSHIQYRRLILEGDEPGQLVRGSRQQNGGGDDGGPMTPLIAHGGLGDVHGPDDLV